MERTAEQPKTAAKKGARRLLRRAALAVVIAVIVLFAAIDIVLLAVFARRGDVRTDGFPLREWAEEHSFEWRSVEFPSGKNTLRGYVVSPREPDALIVIAHGMNASSDGFVPIVRHFAENGFAVLCFDGTAAGRSDGSRMSGFDQAGRDIGSAAAYARESGLLGKLPLVLFGHSTGAYGAAVEAESCGAGAVICVSGFDSPLAVMRSKGVRRVPVLGELGFPLLALHEFILHGKSAGASAAEAIAGSGVPSLIIHGADDGSVELKASIFGKLSDETPENAELLLVDDPAFSAHGNILVSNGGEVNAVLFGAIDGFLRRTLDIPSAAADQF